jgi:hypothetical protein
VIFNTVEKILTVLPAAAVKGFGEALVAILKGDADGAARKARVTAETVAAQQAIRAPYRARARASR